MKSEKIADAVGMVDETLVHRAETKKRTRRHMLKWTAPIAAILVVAIAIGIVFGNSSPFVLKAYAVSEAEYPKMADFPLLGIGPGYDAWREDRSERRTYFGAGKNLGEFIGMSTAEILSGSDGDNLIYSPLNVYMALAMLAEITDGETRDEILTLLNAESIATLRVQANSIWRANYYNDSSVTSILGSSIWLDESIDYNRETLDTLAETYFASSYSGEMGSSSYNKALQTWLNEQTGGLLKDAAKEIELSYETVLALATTIYFKAKWHDEFSKSDNTTDIFYGAKRNETVTFMHERNIYGTYYWGEHFSATKKSLENSGSMYFILPDEGVSIDELLQDDDLQAFLTTATLYTEETYENHKEMIVNLSVPKFDVNSNINLTENLRSLGIESCFSLSDSDFSPLTSDTEIFLSDVNHAARVMMDEEGVTAVAYTVIEGAGAAMPPDKEIDFIVDRPFLFMITGEDGLPLFIGVVNQIG